MADLLLPGLRQQTQAMNTITFFVDGTPKGQPRPKAFSRGGIASVYDPGTAEGWKGCVALAAKDKRPTEPFTGALELTLHFFFPRPKNHFRTGKNASLLRDDSPLRHTGKPDSDNLAKAVMDAMTQLAFWKDDGQVAILVVTKAFDHTKPGCDIILNTL